MNKFTISILSVLMIFALLIAAVGCGEADEDASAPSSETTVTPGTSSASPEESIPAESSDTESITETSSTEESSAAPDGDAQTIVGKWDCSWNMSELFNAMITMSDEEMGEFVRIEKLNFPMQFTFGADGTYTVSADEEAIRESLAGMVEELLDGLNRYFEHMIGENDLDMTVEELLAASGFDSMDEYIDAMMSGFEGTAESFETTGKWSIADGKLYILEEADGFELNEYYTYELTENRLTLLELTVEDGDSEDMEELFDALLGDLFPMVLTRAE